MCWKCVSSLHDQLEIATWLVNDLQVTVERLDHVGSRVPSRGSSVVPLPFRIHAAQARDGLKVMLALGIRYTPAQWATLDTGPVLLKDLTSAVRVGLQIIDLPEELRYLGRCGGNDGACNATLVVSIDDDWATCDVCGESWSVADRQNTRLAQAWDAYARPAVIVRALSNQGLYITKKTLENWIARGLVLPNSRQEYCVADVYAVAKRMRRKHY